MSKGLIVTVIEESHTLLKEHRDKIGNQLDELMIMKQQLQTNHSPELEELTWNLLADICDRVVGE